MKPAADMTTDEIAADIRQRLDANPAHAAALQPVADRLTQAMRDRLPYIDETEIGAVLVNLGAYITHALQLFSSGGIDPATTGQTVANVVAIAGAQMYGPGTTPTTNEQEHAMADQPTPEQLREFAARLVREAHVDYDFMGIGEQMSDAPELRDLDEVPFSEAQSAISDLISSAVVTVSWLDEQPQDGYAVRVLDMLDADPDRFQDSEEDDLRAVLHDLFQCTAEAANLASALAEVTAELDAANANAAEIADQRTAYREEIMRLRARVRELEAAQPERDGDVRAVAQVCADFGNDEGPRGIRQLHARFADRIAALEARDAKGGE